MAITKSEFGPEEGLNPPIHCALSHGVANPGTKIPADIPLSSFYEKELDSDAVVD